MRSSCFFTLPVLVRGSSSTRITALGTWKPPAINPERYRAFWPAGSEFNLITVALSSDYELEKEYAAAIIARRDQYEEIIAGIIREGIEQHLFRPLPVKMVINLIMGAANWIGRWYNPRGSWSMQEISQFYADYLVAPLLAPR